MLWQNARNNNKSAMFILVFFIIFLPLSYFIPLFETTDGRYAEIAREMIASGNWVVPKLNGITHFHKPPAAYWLIACGLELFGINSLGARFFGLLSAVLTLIFTYKIAYLLSDDRRLADSAVFATGTSLLFIVVSSSVSIDIYLTATVAIALYLIFRTAKYGTSFGCSILFGTILGIGFLLKGQMIFLFTIIPLVLASIFNPSFRKLFKPAFFIPAIAIFILLSLPWFVYIINTYDDMLNYFIGYHLVDRVASDTFQRTQEWYYYLMVLFGMFPFFIYTVYGIFKEKAYATYSLWAFVVVPLVVFQLSASKLPAYLTPLTPLISIFAVSVILKNINKKFLIPAYLYVGFLILLPLVAGYVLDYLRPFRLMLIIASLVSCLIFYALYKKKSEAEFIRASAWSVLVVVITVYMVIPHMNGNIRTYKQLANATLTDNLPVVAYKSYLPSVSFYRNEIVPSILGKERDLRFEKNNDYKQYYVNTEAEAHIYFSQYHKLYIIASSKLINEAEERYGYSCDIINQARKLNLYLCESD